MPIEHTNWDNLRLFLSVVRAQSAQEAARRLGVVHSTGTRRLHRLEKELGAQLFERTPAGHVLTLAGHRLLEHVQQMENSMVRVGEEVGGERHALTGHVRLGATEGFGSFFLAPHLSRFTERHPGIQVELLIVPRFINLSQREAGLAVNVERPHSSGQMCSKLTDYRLPTTDYRLPTTDYRLPTTDYRLYAHRDYLARHAPITHPRDLRGHRFVGYVKELVFSDELRYLASVLPQARTPLRSTSVVAQYHVVCAGRAMAVLPCFMAAHHPQLVPVLPGVIDVQRTFWIAAPANRRDLARVRALWDFLREVVAGHQPLLMDGCVPGAGQPPQ